MALRPGVTGQGAAKSGLYPGSVFFCKNEVPVQNKLVSMSRNRVSPELGDPGIT